MDLKIITCVILLDLQDAYLQKAYSTLLQQHFIKEGNSWEGNIARNMDVGCDLQV
jgi:hypothetical protein